MVTTKSGIVVDHYYDPIFSKHVVSIDGMTVGRFDYIRQSVAVAEELVRALDTAYDKGRVARTMDDLV